MRFSSHTSISFGRFQLRVRVYARAVLSSFFHCVKPTADQTLCNEKFERRREEFFPPTSRPPQPRPHPNRHRQDRHRLQGRAKPNIEKSFRNIFVPSAADRTASLCMFLEPFESNLLWKIPLKYFPNKLTERFKTYHVGAVGVTALRTRVRHVKARKAFI